MKVLVDFTQIPRTRTGVGVYADHLLEELIPLLAPEDRLLVVLQEDETDLPYLLPQDTRISFLTIPSSVFRNRLALLLYEQIWLPWLSFRQQADIVHSLHYTFPLLATVLHGARVVTVHDLTFFLWPQLHTRARRLIFRPFIRRALRVAEAVVFVSASTARDAELLVPQRNQLRSVTPLGVTDDAFLRPDEATIHLVLRRLQLHTPFLLFIGTIEPRKNVVRLIQAFERLALKFPELNLVLAGKLGWEPEPFQRAFAESAVAKRIRVLGFITEEEKQALLAAASVLVYPSLYEGFGLPVLEAMAMGIPVVTSNVSSLSEVAGEGALLVDPTSVDEIADAVNKLLTDQTFASSLAAAGQTQARTFTWRQTAQNTYITYCALQTTKRRSARSKGSKSA